MVGGQIHRGCQEKLTGRRSQVRGSLSRRRTGGLTDVERFYVWTGVVIGSFWTVTEE